MCKYVCVYICIYECADILMQTDITDCVGTYICMYVDIPESIDVSMYIIHVCLYVWTYVWR